MADINLGVGGANSAVGGYDIDNSLKVEQDNTEYLTRTVSSTGNRKTGTISMWIKRTEVGVLNYIFEMGGTDNNTDRLHCRFNSSDTLNLATGSINWRITNRVFRDTSAWYHLVVAIDTTQATASNRVKIYINGVEETSFSTSNDPSQNDNTGLAYQKQVIAYSAIDATGSLSGYLTDVYVIDGQQLAPTDFGEFDTDTGIWKPKAYTGSYGTNGFYLDFENSASLGADGSGNSNNFTLSNITSVDQATDTPTNNFCTLNILDERTDTPSTTTEGATVNRQNPGSGTGAVRGTMGVNSGKWYWEFEIDDYTAAGVYYYIYGISSLNLTGARYPGQGDGGYGVGLYSQNGNVYYNGTATAFDTNNVGVDGDLIGVFLDLDNGTLRFAKNGTLMGNVSGTDAISVSSASLDKGFYTAAFSDGTNSTAYVTRYKVNFGGYTTVAISTPQSDANGYGTFEYSPNDGTYDYYALCTKNLAEFG